MISAVHRIGDKRITDWCSLQYRLEDGKDVCSSLARASLGASWKELISWRFLVSKSVLVPRISLPSRASGIALDWTSVGVEKCCCAIACRSRGSRPRVSKLKELLGASLESTAVGTSSSSSLRFMTAMVKEFQISRLCTNAYVKDLVLTVGLSPNDFSASLLHRCHALPYYTPQ